VGIYFGTSESLLFGLSLDTSSAILTYPINVAYEQSFTYLDLLPEPSLMNDPWLAIPSPFTLYVRHSLSVRHPRAFSQPDGRIQYSVSSLLAGPYDGCPHGFSILFVFCLTHSCYIIMHSPHSVSFRSAFPSTMNLYVFMSASFFMSAFGGSSSDWILTTEAGRAGGATKGKGTEEHGPPPNKYLGTNPLPLLKKMEILVTEHDPFIKFP
jgi:hypothetical protein